jgi:hypothetical protein
MANTLEMLHDGHARVLDHEANQTLAAARDR